MIWNQLAIDADGVQQVAIRQYNDGRPYLAISHANGTIYIDGDETALIAFAGSVARACGVTKVTT